MKSLEVAKWRKDEWWMKNDEGWRMNDEGRWFQAVDGFWLMTDRQTDICDCRITFMTENYVYKQQGCKMKEK